MWLTPNKEQALQLLMWAYLTAARKSHPLLMVPSFSFLPACLPAKRPCSALMAAFVIVPGKLMLARVPGTGWWVQTGLIPFWTKPPPSWVCCSSSCTGTIWAKHAVWFSESWKMSLLITRKQSEIVVKFWKVLVCFSFQWLHQSSGKEGCPCGWWLMAILQITDARRHS